MKRKQLDHKARGIKWLIGNNSPLSLENKTLICKTILKPIWTYGIELWGWASKSSIAIIIIIIIIIIIFININWVITRWQWLFYMYTNMERKKK